MIIIIIMPLFLNGQKKILAWYINEKYGLISFYLKALVGATRHSKKCVNLAFFFSLIQDLTRSSFLLANEIDLPVQSPLTKMDSL